MGCSRVASLKCLVGAGWLVVREGDKRVICHSPSHRLAWAVHLAIEEFLTQGRARIDVQALFRPLFALCLVMSH